MNPLTGIEVAIKTQSEYDIPGHLPAFIGICPWCREACQESGTAVEDKAQEEE